MSEPRSLSELLSDFQQNLPQGEISIAQILETFHERGFGVLLFFFAIPMAVPLPVPPGINIALATPLIFLTAQQMLGRHTIWLPVFLTGKSISRETMNKLLRMVIPWTKKLEWFVRPRFGWMTHGVFSHLIGLVGLIMALTVAIPLPLTNTAPSFSIACMAIGVVMRDGLAVVTGTLFGLAWVMLLLVVGEAGIRFLLTEVIG